VQSNGRRCSTYHAFLPKALVQERPNLFICLGAHVQKVLFTNEEKSITAKGVLLESGGRLYAAEATHEIILCGGAIVTPQLLLLRYCSLHKSADNSGIGPKDHLKNVDKPCLHDLPGVGSTLVLFLPSFLIQIARSRLCSINVHYPVFRLCTSVSHEPFSCHPCITSIFHLRHRLFRQHDLRILLFLPFR